MRKLFGFPTIVISLLLTVLSAFFSLPLPTGLKSVIETTSLICIMSPVIGGCLIAYGSECGTAFKPRPNREEAAIAVGFYKLAVRISIGSGFFGTVFGWIAMLRSMGGGWGDDMGAVYGGLAVSLITILYGVVFAFTIFLPFQYYFQHQLDKDS